MAPIDLGTEAPVGRALYWRLSPIAARVGVSPRAFLADIEAGRIPIRVCTFTERQLPMLHSADTMAWLAEIGKGLAS